MGLSSQATIVFSRLITGIMPCIRRFPSHNNSKEINHDVFSKNPDKMAKYDAKESANTYVSELFTIGATVAGQREDKWP